MRTSLSRARSKSDVSQSASPRVVRPLTGARARAVEPAQCEAKGKGSDLSRVPLFASTSSAGEQRARSVAERVRRAPGAPAVLTTEPDADGTRLLSGIGQAFFERLVGGPIARARFHVDESAHAAARALGARAFTRGGDVFVPPSRFRPETADGRALLGHELAHVGEPEPRSSELSCDGEPHYPSASEQRDIERSLGRARTTNAGTGKTGTVLTNEESDQLAKRLMPSLYEVLEGRDSARAAGLGHDTTVRDSAEALGLVEKAQRAVRQHFAEYGLPSFDLTTNERESPGERRAASRLVVSAGLGTDSRKALLVTVIQTDCPACKEAIDPLEDGSRARVIRKMLEWALAEKGDLVGRVTEQSVGGLFDGSDRRIRLGQRSADAYHSAVHEVVHAMAHPVFTSAFSDERNIIEGFTEYLAQEVAPSDKSKSYAGAVDAIRSVKRSMSGPFAFSEPGGSPEESLRLAYFKGRLELIGWTPSSTEEAEAVQKAGGAAKWNPDTAKEKQTTYDARARAMQDPHSNRVGVGVGATGIIFARSGPTLSVRYARVLTRFDPLAKYQLVGEGQVEGQPFDSPARLGASLGLAFEYQEPHLYLSAGVRAVGSAALTGAANPRVDFAPVIGGGVRLFQRVRIGAEVMGLFPVTGQRIDMAAGGHVTFEW